MSHAHEEIQLEKARRDLAAMMECAVRGCHMDGDAFFRRFLRSGLAEAFERGDPDYLGRFSGAKLVEEVLYRTTKERRRVRPFKSRGTSPEYWAGQALACCQWYTGRRFQEIHEALPFSEAVDLYPAMHKDDISRFVRHAEKRMSAVWENRLKKYRERRDLSQEELANRSGVPLREIQAYEQNSAGINNAPLLTVYRLAGALRVSMETLLEFPVE